MTHRVTITVDNSPGIVKGLIALLGAPTEQLDDQVAPDGWPQPCIVLRYDYETDTEAVLCAMMFSDALAANSFQYRLTRYLIAHEEV